MAEDTKKADDVEAPKASKKQKVKLPAYYVATGCAITSKKGVLASEKGEPVTEIKKEYLADAKAFDSLIDSGHIKKGD